MKDLGGVVVELTEEEVEAARRMLEREPNPLEWAMIDTEWSEHCSYKSSRKVLRLLPTEGERVVLGPGFDAGVIDVGDGFVVTIHIESHNHPSAIDPYGGAATGIGGVLRDIVCMGTRPIALVDSLRFGRIDRSRHSVWLFQNVVRGIADYGNCVGVPTVAGEVEFDRCFERNCLVDVACIGVGLKKNLVTAVAKHAGDLLILAGGSTGRDGIRGATFASRVLTETSDSERASVQVPDPFMKKLILEATLEAVETGFVRGLKDLGGGGLTCAVSETVFKGARGAEIDLSKIHLREPDMEPMEIMISESQERMLFVVDPQGVQAVTKIFEKYEVPYAVIGRVMEEGDLEIRHGELLLAKLPAKAVAEAPLIKRGSSKPSYIDELRRVPAPQQPPDLSDVLLRLLSSPNIASKEWVYRQYDHEVGVRTVVKPGQADAAVMKLPNGRFLALKSDGNSKHCYLDPYDGAMGCISEACRNVVAVGALPVAMVDHLQFGDPGKPDVYWTFVEAVRGLADYCLSLRLPCVGGKVSFYNEDTVTNAAIKPSPVVLVVGLIERPEAITTMPLKGEGDLLLMVGKTRPEMGGSEYYEYIHGLAGGRVPKVDLKREGALFKFVHTLIEKRVVRAVHDCSKGGLSIAITEMCISGGLGAEVDCSRIPSSTERLDELLFSESHGRFILEVDPKRLEETLKLASESGLECSLIGRAQGERILFSLHRRPIIDLHLGRAEEVWREALPKYLGELA